MKARLLNLFLSLVTCFLVLVVCEMGLRLYYYGSLSAPDFDSESLNVPHPTRGWALEPNRSAWQQTMSYRILVSTNSRGLRDVEHDIEKRPGTYRVLVLGDSYMEAYQVELEESLPKLLEEDLRSWNVETINFGVGGYGTAQQYLALTEEGLRYEPDLVLLGLYLGNDVRNNSRVLEQQLWQKDKVKVFARPFATLSPDGSMSISEPDFDRYVAEERAERRDAPLHKATVLYKLWSMAKNAVDAGKPEQIKYDPNVYFGPFIESFEPSAYSNPLSVEEYEREWASAWKTTRALLKKMETACREAGADFVVFLVPHEIQYDDSLFERVVGRFPEVEFDRGKVDVELDRIRRDGIAIIDLTPSFRDAYRRGEGPLTYPDDRHWNPGGHRLASETIAARLEQVSLNPDHRD